MLTLPQMNNDFAVNTWDVLDYAANGGAGIGDGITFGFLDDARKYLGINNGINTTSAVYTAGFYTGTAIGMGVSGGAGGGAAATGWAVRTGRVYVMAAKANDVATTAENVANGNISMLDLVALLPGGKTRQILQFKNKDDLVDTAKALYPKLAGKIQQHHVIPKYLGGDAKGQTVPLDAAYHQLITNAFRDAHKYGSAKPSQAELEVIMKKVYDAYPLT